MPYTFYCLAERVSRLVLDAIDRLSFNSFSKGWSVLSSWWSSVQQPSQACKAEVVVVVDAVTDGLCLKENKIFTNFALSDG